MQRIIKHLLFSLFLILFSGSVSAQSGIDIIKRRIVEELMKSRTNAEQVELLLSNLRGDGTWPGIDYQDLSRTGFQHSRHSANMVTLARAYKTKGTKFYMNKKVKNTIESALKNWVDNDYFCDNWWHNQIGTPDNLVSLMLIMGDELPIEIVEKARPIIGRAHLDASGARPSGDRIKIAGILAKNLIFNSDLMQFGEVIKVIEGEIKFSTGMRGMQNDYSFHHREDRVNNTLSYGLGYADTFAEWAAYVAGTSYKFSPEKINQLIDYYLDGICKQMVYGKTHDPGTRNRDIARPGSIRPMGTTTPERLIKVTDYRRDELEEVIKIRRGEPAYVLSFGKFFWQTEHYVHQRPQYFTSVRMYSTRNRNMEEPYNSEGLKNHHRGDGANYISLTGEEYNNIAPVYDWQKIPGTTILQKPELPTENEIQKDGLTDFVGALTDGLYGVVAFDFKSPHDPLAARKVWFFFDEEYVCLGSGITSHNNLPVVTTLNQCLLEGEVAVMINNKRLIQPEGDHKLENVRWVYHDSIGYIFARPVNVNLLNFPQTGNWYNINRQSGVPREDITLPVFKLWIEHGQRPQNESYQYIVVPGISINDLEKVPLSRNIEILSNTSEIQAVRHKELNICQFVFYKGNVIQISDKLKLISDVPGIIMLKSDGTKIIEVTVADPNRELGRYHLSLSQKIETSSVGFSSVWNERTGFTDIAIDLPGGVYSGQSVTVKLH